MCSCWACLVNERLFALYYQIRLISHDTYCASLHLIPPCFSSVSPSYSFSLSLGASRFVPLSQLNYLCLRHRYRWTDMEQSEESLENGKELSEMSNRSQKGVVVVVVVVQGEKGSGVKILMKKGGRGTVHPCRSWEREKIERKRGKTKKKRKRKAVCRHLTRPDQTGR